MKGAVLQRKAHAEAHTNYTTDRERTNSGSTAQGQEGDSCSLWTRETPFRRCLGDFSLEEWIKLLEGRC